ncbi:5-amino-6-(5-phospho-D-ribitylamino)uracil phosphatase, chloroplastic-like [Durio zibethinus]|uniref:5-amino-6-(5-phospho-D-ribitylamino)uracil phosphatase, chloroplastic-like n=1 Tax=Durio zibethinus TaxID=66656 RepID=A0A6P5WSA1_DURZI|nr:5-amino-6-(5-phospho-D-ribitylamino)uracil phosphatase, chloroplastic-like [Durio zibethinus]XP_022718387.1 5-amino-6-(5-phospho-D-ribitylamino)uracil phosphatase, chloroplastic-like [Durio zibethinus]
MVLLESIATTSLLGHPPFCGSISIKDVSCKPKSLSNCWFPSTEFIGKRIVVSPLPRLRVERLINSSIKALAMELTKEVHAYRDEERTPRDWNYQIDTGVDRKPGLWPPENRADNPLLRNPLLRQERMGCGWFGALFEWEGVIIEDNPLLEKQVWLALAEEEGKSPPPVFILRRIEGMKNEQAISEVLCWSREPAQLRRMAARKEEIYQALQGGIYRLRDGSQEFVNALTRYKIPIALVSTRPRKVLETAIRAIGIEGFFSVIIAAEDVHRGKPDPEMFVYAAQLLKFIPERCIVFGNSNQTVEAAHDAQMKCVAVASKHPVYELGAADLVINRLDDLSIVDLKNLADIESPEFGSGKPELQVEMEEEEYGPSTSTVDDIFW